MKPIGCSNSSLAKPPILPKPLKHRMPSLSPTPRDLVHSPSRDSPSPITEDDVTTLSPRQVNAVKVRSPRRPLLPLPNGTDKKTRPSRTNDRCRDLDLTLTDQVHSLNIRRPSAVPTNVDFSILRKTRDSRGEEEQESNGKLEKKDHERVTSSNEEESSPQEGVVVADVIYDKPMAEFERKSLQRMIRSDGYVRIGPDVAESTTSGPLIRYRKCSFRGGPGSIIKTTLNPSSSDKDVRHRWSTESVNLLDNDDVLLDFRGVCPDRVLVPGSRQLRSSFVDPNGPPPIRKNVYLELGEYQTLLKHSRNDEDRVYSLPQPQCYGEDTLRAVKLITEKYDTFKRRQLRALSFRDGTCAFRRSQDEEGLPGKTPGSGDHDDDQDQSPTSFTDNGLTGSPIADSNDRRPETTEVDCTSERTSKLRPSGWLSLRDYCNTLETDADARDAHSGGSGGGLSRWNLMRIELFYRSRETCVYVARCLADLFVGTLLGDDTCPAVHQHTGVPVWVLNTGLGVRTRELLLVLAERETGFPLWQDRINYLSDYHSVTPDTHSVRVSGSLRKMVRLHMFCERSAEEFLARFNEIASDPQDDLWKVSVGDRKSRKTGRRKKRRRPRLSKSSISQPVNFVHISCVDPCDPNFRAAFSGLVPMQNGKSPPTGAADFSTAPDTVESPMATSWVTDSRSTDNQFRPRLPTR